MYRELVRWLENDRNAWIVTGVSIGLLGLVGARAIVGIVEVLF